MSSYPSLLSPELVTCIFTCESHLHSPVLLELQDGPAELLLELAALLNGQRVRLLGERLSDFSQVTVVVHLESVEGKK